MKRKDPRRRNHRTLQEPDGRDSPPTGNPVSPALAGSAQPAIDKGVRQAENWLADQIEGQLWTAFAFGRDSLPTPMQKTAFEVAFLTRLQQRLVAARRSG